MKFVNVLFSVLLMLVVMTFYVACVPANDESPYTVTFKNFDGTILKTELVEEGNSATAPTVPPRTGFTFTSWDEPFDNITRSKTITAQFSLNSYNLIYYEEDGVTPIQSTAYQFGSNLENHDAPIAPAKIGFTHDEWQPLPNAMPAEDVIRVATYTEDAVLMKRVGSSQITYTVPIGEFDNATASVTGGYLMAAYETTYELWYEVRVWAEANGYHFQNQGREGSAGAIGQPPTVAAQEPVTDVSWRDVIVWLNALSEKYDFDPVYRTPSDDIIKDARAANGAVVDAAVQTNHNGYRLPTNDEWEMAARWKNDTSSTDGSILIGGRYWTPGEYASGATSDYLNATATQLVGWYFENSDWTTQPVGQLVPNHLGIYDMSGNVLEFMFTASGDKKIRRGGSYDNAAMALRIGITIETDSDAEFASWGFRIVRNP